MWVVFVITNSIPPVYLHCSYFLSNLQSGLNYQVEVGTVSDVPTDPAAIIRLNTSFIIQSPGPVGDLTATLTESSLTIMWSPPNNSSTYHSLLQILDYEVRLVNESGTTIRETVVPPNVSQVVYDVLGSADIMLGMNYTVSVAARNQAGKGEVESTVVTTGTVVSN